jgi:alpha-beta hydrolase superfamily lysophospholipase
MRALQHGEGTLTGPRGSRIYYQYWLPDGDPKAVLLVVHGLGEHSGRYGNVVNHFVPRGYGVYALDHYGHGKSEGQREYVERFGDYTQPLKIFFDKVQGWQPGKRIFLVGHSLGGLISADYLLEHQAGLSGAVLSGPAVKAPSLSPVLLVIGRLMSALLPTMGVLALDSSAISRDPQVVRAYLNDPLVFTGKTTARLGAETIDAMRRVQAGASTLALPLLILQGSADRLVDPSGAELLYRAAGSADKTLKVYPGLYHEIYNEPEREQVLHDVETWLEAHL